MRKLALFPYHPDMLTLLDHIDFLVDHEICGFFSYIEDEKRVQALNDRLGVADASYESVLESCDAVVLLDNYRGFKPDKYYQVIEDARRYNKGIIITPLAQSQLKLGDYNGQYSLLEHLPDGMDAIEQEYALNEKIVIYDINAPIIGVFGQGKNCEKFNTQLMIKEARYYVRIY